MTEVYYDLNWRKKNRMEQHPHASMERRLRKYRLCYGRCATYQM